MSKSLAAWSVNSYYLGLNKIFALGEVKMAVAPVAGGIYYVTSASLTPAGGYPVVASKRNQGSTPTNPVDPGNTDQGEHMVTIGPVDPSQAVQDGEKWQFHLIFQGENGQLVGSLLNKGTGKYLRMGAMYQHGGSFIYADWTVADDEGVKFNLYPTGDGNYIWEMQMGLTTPDEYYKYVNVDQYIDSSPYIKELTGTIEQFYKQFPVFNEQRLNVFSFTPIGGNAIRPAKKHNFNRRAGTTTC
jgi:hypothetical protein